MKRLTVLRMTWASLAAALALAGAGCILTSGQIELHFDLPDLSGSSSSNIVGQAVDLNEEDDYNDYKEDLQGVTNLAVLGEITNNPGSDAVDVEVWITPHDTTYANAAALKGDPKAKLLWGPFALASGATEQIDWDESAALFKDAGKSILLQEVKGDGTFTIYAVGAQGTYDFDVDNGVLVLSIDVGI
jgi:hypothetical protein